MLPWKETPRRDMFVPVPTRLLVTLVAAAFALPAAVLGQGRAPRIVGTWRAETPEGPRDVMIRPDSSASFGDETIRWRLVGDSIYLAFGDEWMGYTIKLRGDQLTVAGGDLEEPMTLRRAGPWTPRPDSIPLPPAPPNRGQPATTGVIGKREA